MNCTINGRATRCLGFAFAFLLISASATLGAYFGFVLGSHQHVALGVIFAAAALGGEGLKPIAVAAAFEALRSREFLRAFACAALALVCIVYSLAAELSLAAGARGDMASARQLSTDAVQGARERRTRASAELSGLAPARSPAELEPLISKLKASPSTNGCTGQPDTLAGRKSCGDALLLQSEAARAVRRAELAAIIAEADRAISDRGDFPNASAGAADPLASALSAYASALGRPVTADTISPWLALIPVLFLELGSALSLIVVRSLGTTPSGQGEAAGFPNTRRRREASAEQVLPITTAAPPRDAAEISPGEPSPPASATEADTPPASVPSAPRKPNRDRDDKGDRKPPRGGRRLGAMADLIRANGGRLEGGQRGIAKALGVSKSRANEMLHALAAAGAIHLAVGPAGTTVELVTA